MLQAGRQQLALRLQERLLGGNAKLATARESHVCQGDAGSEPQPYRGTNAGPDEGAFGSANASALGVPNCGSVCGADERPDCGANAEPDGCVVSSADGEPDDVANEHAHHKPLIRHQQHHSIFFRHTNNWQ